MAEERARLLGQAVELHRRRRSAEAERLYREILARWPGSAEAEHYLGNLLVEGGRVAEGMRHIDASIALRPAEPLFHFNRATILLRLGRAEAAIGAFREVLKRIPDDLASHVNLAAACRRAGRPEEALPSLEFVLERQPDLVEARHNLANCLADLGRIDEALVEYERALEARPDALDVRMSLGSNLCRLGDYEAAIGHFRRALERSPDDARVHMQLANALKAVGDLAGAERHLRRVLAIEPAHAEAHQTLANVVRHRAGDPDIAAMEGLIARSDIDDEARLRLNFALGKAYADIGEHDRSFACYEVGNRLRRAALDYDPSTTDAFFERIERVFAHDLPTLPEGASGTDGPRPIFIVGMPRSGTSLIEQILASHPDVFGAGESPALGQCVDRALAGAGGFPEGLRALPPETLAGIGTAYRRCLGEQARRAGHPDPRVVSDKMPQNFRLVGLIAHCLPDAVILHTRRHPLDVCLSCYEQNFVGDHPYAYDLLEIARYYLAYERLMTFWHRRLPGRIHDVDYGRLVADGEAGIRRLVGIAGLRWDDRCLDFHSVRRAVATASDSQVRRPIYRSSVERWRRHEAALAPAKALFVEAGLLDDDGNVRGTEGIDGRP